MPRSGRRRHVCQHNTTVASFESTINTMENFSHESVRNLLDLNGNRPSLQRNQPAIPALRRVTAAAFVVSPLLAACGTAPPSKFFAIAERFVEAATCMQWQSVAC